MNRSARHTEERSLTATELRQRTRILKDHIARYAVTFGGIGVIIAVVLIFFYLLFVVIPLFKPASIEPVASYRLTSTADDDQTLYLAMEEQAEIGVRFTRSGLAQFFFTHSGAVMTEQAIPLPPDTRVTSFAAGAPDTAVVAFGLSNGTAILVRHVYQISFPNDKRVITPKLEYPLGEAPLVIDGNGRPLRLLAVQSNEEQTSFGAVTDDDRLVFTYFARGDSFLDDEEEEEDSTVERGSTELQGIPEKTRFLLLGAEQDYIYAANREGALSIFTISDPEEPALDQRLPSITEGSEITAMELLSGGISLMVASADGTISQWFPVRDESGKPVLTHIRDFDSQSAAITALTPEFYRKGFLAADTAGNLGIYHATAHRTLLVEPVGKQRLERMAISPRANAMLGEDAEGEFHFLRIDNEHPETSFSSLWGKVWYEGYSQPEYIWQSSSASDGFEPKLSLTPITFGTLKAAFYAMLVALPLAILGAIFTAQFMAPKMRQLVKPTIEIMEALPTVIIGFLAGLWLAPTLETHLPGIFALLLILPVGVLLFAWLWTRVLPESIRHKIPESWEAALLLPVVALLSWFSFAISPLLEYLLFDGNMILWLTHDLGIPFDQRNSLVVGLAMGFAVIPTIFSMAEDALFGVPKHLIRGSLALGATPWQTLIRVTLLTASPGIFAAVMIGLGRAVGETMIVLMATGNTPVMDFSIFQGMRTLSANTAVEMPEAEVASTHYRVLFLAALVLFTLTFLFNTLAELVRQRLRKKYSTL